MSKKLTVQAFDKLASRSVVLRGVDHKEKPSCKSTELHLWVIAKYRNSDQHFMASFGYSGSRDHPTPSEELEGVDMALYPRTFGPHTDDVLHDMSVAGILVGWEKNHLQEWMEDTASVVILKKPSGSREVLAESDRQVLQHLIRMRTRIAHHWKCHADHVDTSLLTTDLSIVAAETAFYRLNGLIHSINRRWENVTGR